MFKLRLPEVDLEIEASREDGHILLSAPNSQPGMELRLSAPFDDTNDELVEICGRYDDATASGQASPELSRRLAEMGGRAGTALGYFTGPLRRVAQWLLWSQETTNFTYDLTDRNKAYLAHTVSLVTGRPVAEIQGYLAEPESDGKLMGWLRLHAEGLSASHPVDREPRFGRRLGWYAVVRAMKPAIVVETGVEKGLGSVLLCAALARNNRDGSYGEYVGTDIDPQAGILLDGSPFARYGRILYGDSLKSLGDLDCPVDVFINDSDHSAAYEVAEYDLIESKLSSTAIVLGDNAHITDALQKFAEKSGRRFLYFNEVPKDHWYPGAGIGFAFR
jgi:predicted O-methyltransferase YrrM